MKVAVIGGGWAGLAAAVAAAQAGHAVTLLEAARHWGGRARSLSHTLPDGTPAPLDNGQHILVGAYTATLGLMRQLGLAPETVLRRLPLQLLYPDGQGLRCPDWPAPWDLLAGIVRARGWGWRDKAALLKVAAGWRRRGFACPATTTVAQLAQGLTPRVCATLIEPLCVSALNTPMAQASGQVFLRVLQDSLFAPGGGANLLLPTTDLDRLLPRAALAWLSDHGATLRPGHRVMRLAPQGGGWQVDGEAFDAVLLACPPGEAARLVDGLGRGPAAWAATARALPFEAITTVYTWTPGVRLAAPLLALRSGPAAPAQFVFDRGQLGGPDGLLAWVVSASQGERAALQQQVLAQAQAQLGLTGLQPLTTVVEKRATFACTPALQRPAMAVAPGLWACGDFVAGPYPATLEGAVRHGLAAAALATR